MRRRALLLIVLLLMGLVAGCDGEPADTPATTGATEPPEDVETSTLRPTFSGTPPGDASCVLDPIEFPTSSGVPPVTAQDQVYGPEDATITFIEYADFQ
jgi:hypothetical protein